MVVIIRNGTPEAVFGLLRHTNRQSQTRCKQYHLSLSTGILMMMTYNQNNEEENNSRYKYFVCVFFKFVANVLCLLFLHYVSVISLFYGPLLPGLNK